MQVCEKCLHPSNAPLNNHKIPQIFEFLSPATEGAITGFSNTTAYFPTGHTHLNVITITAVIYFAAIVVAATTAVTLAASSPAPKFTTKFIATTTTDAGMI